MIHGRNPDAGRIYHIRVQGSLDAKWTDWFDNFAMASRDGQCTLLAGRVADQAELHGLMARIRSLGLPLRLVVQADCPCRKAKCPRQNHCVECYEHHTARGGLPYCLRERTRWDKQCKALIS